MPYNERSKHITGGIARSPNRAMYYALGYQTEDFDKPMIGIANGHSTITPCNAGLQPLADAAIAAVKAAGGNPQVFGTPTISDGMAMGTEGMKYSLISREVIADCIETCVQGQWTDRHCARCPRNPRRPCGRPCARPPPRTPRRSTDPFPSNARA